MPKNEKRQINKRQINADLTDYIFISFHPVFVQTFRNINLLLPSVLKFAFRRDEHTIINLCYAEFIGAFSDQYTVKFSA